MKKIILSIAASLLILHAAANPIDADKARMIAVDFLPSTPDMTLVATAPRNLAKARKLSAKVAATSPYYIYSRGEGQGFVIVAGDDCLPTILGYTETGDFDASNLPPALQAMLNGWAQAVEDRQVAGTNQTVYPLLAASDRENITPFMTSHWHQNSPYNDRCPIRTGTTARAVTGCVATAASQILYYWRRDLPSTLQATTPTYGYGDAPVTESIPAGTPLRWDLMKDSYTGSESAEVKNAVAEFVFATGAATWLTYGASTAGNIEKVPDTYRGFFGMNGGTVHYRNSYTQENWVQLLYDELMKGHPIMYTGQSDTQGGHAVVVHGYQKSGDLFRFNFGWGGTSDGYYNVTAESGMNGFYGYQSCLIGAYPKKWNINVDMTAPDKVYAQRTNDFKITYENNSTLSQKGFYLFASISSVAPSALRNAKSSDTETVIPTGSTATFSLSCKPTSARTWYITLTDADLNILKQITVEPEIPTSNLKLLSVSSAASADTEEIDGIKYNKFYSKRAVINVEMQNNEETIYEGTGKVAIYVFNEESQEWELNGTNSLSNLTIPANSSSVLSFNVSSTQSCPLEAGRRYYAEVQSPWGSSGVTDEITIPDEASSRTYFIITGENGLSVDSYTDGVVTFSGAWDKSSFESTVRLTTYSAANAYNLTDVKYFTDNYNQSLLPNPNALVYVTGTELYDTPNIINAQGECFNLQLVKGYDFQPRAEIQALSATLQIDKEISRWQLVTIPFSCDVPDGIYARQIDSHRSSGLSTSTVSTVRTLEAGHTYLLMTSVEWNNILMADSQPEPAVTILSAPLTNTDAAIIGTFVSSEIPVGAMIVNDEATQYFDPVTATTVVPGLGGYFYDSAITRKFRVNASTTVDPAYITLAENISKCYDILEADTENTFEARELFLQTINEAERMFSDRTLTSSVDMRNYNSELMEIAENFKNGSIADSITFVADTIAPAIVSQIYNFSGQPIPSLQTGINIVRYNDGSVRKIFVK